MKKEFSAGTNAQSSTEADNSTSASVEANPMLPAVLLVGAKLCLTASSLGEKITQSIKAIGNPDLKTIELKTGSADR